MKYKRSAQEPVFNEAKSSRFIKNKLQSNSAIMHEVSNELSYFQDYTKKLYQLNMDKLSLGKISNLENSKMIEE